MYSLLHILLYTLIGLEYNTIQYNSNNSFHVNEYVVQL